ncbi:hypothetical protein ACLKA7_000435 [Drosophila subpalustris]
MSESIENCEEFDEEFHAIMRLSNSEAIRELKLINENLKLIKAQTFNRRNNLAVDLVETKRNRRVELNKNISSILSNVMNQLAEAARLEDELNKVENEIKNDDQKLESCYEERPKEKVDSDEESDHSPATAIQVPNPKHKSDFKTLLQTAKKHTVNTPNRHINERLDRSILALKKEKIESDICSKGLRVMIKKLPGETDGNYRIKLLTRCQSIMRPYGIPMYDFSISWASGHALCALIHHHEPDLIDESYLKCKNSAVTLEYVSGVAKSLGVEFDGCLVKFFHQKRPSYIKVFHFVDTLYRQLVFLP